MPTTLEQLDQAIAAAEKRQGLALADIDAAIGIAESRFELTPDEVKSVQQSMPPKGFLETVAGNTTVGLAGRAINRAVVGEHYIEPEEGDFGPVGNLAAEVGSMVVDPAFIASAGIGSTVAKKLAGQRIAGESLKRGAARGAVAGATTLGLIGGVQDPLHQYRETGEVDPEQSLRAAGEGAALGAALGPASMAGEAVLPRVIGEGIGRRAGRVGTAVAAETATLGTGQAALEGRLPTDEDFLHAAGVVLGMKGAALIPQLAKRLRERGPDADPRKITEEVIGKENTDKAFQFLSERPPENQPSTEPLKPGEAEIPPEPNMHFPDAKVEPPRPLAKGEIPTAEWAAQLEGARPDLAEKLRGIEGEVVRDDVMTTREPGPMRTLERSINKDARNKLRDLLKEQNETKSEETPGGRIDPAQDQTTVQAQEAGPVNDVLGETTFLQNVETSQSAPKPVDTVPVTPAGRAGGVTFTTAKGSTYVVDGTSTVRDKAARPEHPGEQGIQPQSTATYYVTKEQQLALGEIQSQGGPKRDIVALPDGRIGIKYLEGKDKGKIEGRTVVTPKLQPEVGLFPVEVFDGKTPHFGNEITKVTPPREAGAMGIVPGPNDVPLQAIASQLRAGWSGTKAVARAFRSRGDLPPEAFQLNVERTGEIRARTKEAVFHERDLAKAIRKGYGTRAGRLHPSELEKINAYLAGETVDIPTEVAAVLNPMRANIDANSRTILDTMPLGEKLEATIDENMGSYLRRSYKAHHDPAWAENVPQHAKDRFKQQLIDEYWDWVNKAKSEPTMESRVDQGPPTSEAMDGIIAALLHDAKESKNPLAFIAKGKLGSKDLSSLMKRKDLSEAFRALMGEEKDPFINYARTVTNQSQLIANHKFLSQVREAGLGKWLFEEPTTEAKAQIAAEGTRGMNPLNGLYATPELVEAFTNWDTQPAVGPLLRGYYKALAQAKKSKTSQSIQGIVRNFISNPAIEMANGNIALWRIADPTKAIMADLGWTDAPPAREYLERLVRLGVIDDSAGMRELFDIVQRAHGKSFDDALVDPNLNALRKLDKLGVDLWQAADNVYKAYGFETESARYRKAYPEWTPQQVDAKASEIVRNTRPTYSMIPKAARMWARVPLGETFIAWPAEIVRNSYNILHQATTELADPRTRSIGAKRLIGAMAAASAPTIVAGSLAALMGINRQDRDDAQRFALRYQDDATLILLDSPKDGKLRYIDTTFTDPYAVLRKPLLAFMRGDDWKDSFWQSGKSILNTFVGENLIVSALLDSWRGTAQEGYAIYNPQDSAAETGKAIGKRLADPFIPGTWNSLDRIRKAHEGTVEPWGRKYDPATETVALFGLRVQEMDVRQRLMHKSAKFVDDLKDAYGIARDKLLQSGDLTDDDLAGAVGRSGDATARLVGEMHEDVMAAIRLGVPKGDVLQIMQAAGLSRKELGAILANHPQAYQADVGTIRRVLRRSKATGDDVRKRLEEIRRRLDVQKEAA